MLDLLEKIVNKMEETFPHKDHECKVSISLFEGVYTVEYTVTCYTLSYKVIRQYTMYTLNQININLYDIIESPIRDLKYQVDADNGQSPEPAPKKKR
jgi:hypothetical protein